MTLNERILDFLDGSLPADDEAELLHTLSVSPEKRSLLRGFMEQRALLVRDGKALSVPYEAEQRLWARLDLVMPQTPAEVQPLIIPVESSAVGFFARAFSGASATLGALTLVAGIGIGYFAAAHQTEKPGVLVALHSTSEPSNAASLIGVRTNGANRASLRHAPTLAASSSLPLLASVPSEVPTGQIIAPAAISNVGDAPTADQEDRSITPINVGPNPSIVLADIGGDGNGIKPMFHQIRGSMADQPTFLQRFEFRIDESFGRQFPNSIATNVSLPLITNTSIATFFQILPHSNLLWVGASYGTANITRKNLFTSTGNPIDPSQEVLASDTVHAQTSYVAGIAELRLPAFATADLTLSAGYGLASLGQMMFGEIGIHYDVSREVGVQCGLRALRFMYDLSGEKAAAIQSGNGSLVIPNAVEAASPSFNTELNAGLFFHF